MFRQFFHSAFRRVSGSFGASLFSEIFSILQTGVFCILYFTFYILYCIVPSLVNYVLGFQIFLTCGADGAVRLWACDVFEPLITMTTGPTAVVDAAWSPTNSTIIASLSGPCMSLWDLRRKTYYPASTIENPANVNYCTIKVCYFDYLLDEIGDF